MPRGIKRKKELNTNMSSKKQCKSRILKERVPGIQFAAAKIIFKSASVSEKDKKFFKTSSIDRLEKASFTMPLIFKKDVFLNVDRCIKDAISYSKKMRALKEKSYVNKNSDSTEAIKSVSANAVSMNTDNNENSRVNYGSECEIRFSEEVSGVEDNSSGQISSSPKENSIFDFDWPSDELLLKRQEKAREIERQSNCLKGVNVSVQQNIIEEKQSSGAQPVKLYPIFNVRMKNQSKSNQEEKSSPKNVTKKKMDSSNKGEQMFIDAGQKEIGAKICSTCNMVYTIGQLEDERLHINYHDMYLTSLKFSGWKDENMIGEYVDGRVIMIRKGDKSIKLKKIEDILMIANRDLGLPSSSMPARPDVTFVLFVSSAKQVIGCVVAEPITSARQVLLGDPGLVSEMSDQKETFWRNGNRYLSSETHPAICGINRIWVDHNFRRTKVASRMIDCLRCHFIYGHIVGIRELAFTDPSPDGQAFAAAYTGTSNFLVYQIVHNSID